MASERGDWERLVAEFERSGATQAGFAASRGVSVSALRYWIYKLRDEGRASSGGDGVELLPVRVTAAVSQHFEARVSDVQLRFEVGTDPAYVASVLNELDAQC